MSFSSNEKPTEYKMDKSDNSLDIEKSSMSDVEEARIRKSLLWKLDTRILPVLAVLFLFSFLDRTNIGTFNHILF